jgi:hypothetical protein
MKRRKIFKSWLVHPGYFLAVNIAAFFHAYKFTHFSATKGAKTKSESLSFGGKLKALFLASVTGPENKINLKDLMKLSFYKVTKKIECWYIPTDSSNGTVILFHGYGGEKSSMLR